MPLSVGAKGLHFPPLPTHPPASHREAAGTPMGRSRRSPLGVSRGPEGEPESWPFPRTGHSQSRTHSWAPCPVLSASCPLVRAAPPTPCVYARPPLLFSPPGTGVLRVSEMLVRQRRDKEPAKAPGGALLVGGPNDRIVLSQLSCHLGRARTVILNSRPPGAERASRDRSPLVCGVSSISLCSSPPPKPPHLFP